MRCSSGIQGIVRYFPAVQCHALFVNPIDARRLGYGHNFSEDSKPKSSALEGLSYAEL